MIRVLVVDDDPAILELMVDYLEGRGNIEATTASNGQEALRKINLGNPPDVIITDQEMPKMIGTELLERVKIVLAGTVAVLMSGRGGPANHLADLFLQKPNLDFDALDSILAVSASSA